MPVIETRPRLIIKEQWIKNNGNYLKVQMVQYDALSQKDKVLYDQMIQFNLSDDRTKIMKKLKLTLKGHLPKATPTTPNLAADINKEIVLDTLPD